jgi:hypothetical protein
MLANMAKEIAGVQKSTPVGQREGTASEIVALVIKPASWF